MLYFLPSYTIGRKRVSCLSVTLFNIGCTTRRLLLRNISFGTRTRVRTYSQLPFTSMSVGSGMMRSVMRFVFTTTSPRVMSSSLSFTSVNLSFFTFSISGFAPIIEKRSCAPICVFMEKRPSSSVTARARRSLMSVMFTPMSGSPVCLDTTRPVKRITP